MVLNQRCLGDSRTRVTVITNVPQAVWGKVLQFKGLFSDLTLFKSFCQLFPKNLSFLEVGPSSLYATKHIPTKCLFYLNLYTRESMYEIF